LTARTPRLNGVFLKHVAATTRAGRSSRRPAFIIRHSKATLAVDHDIAGRRVRIKLVVMPRVLAIAKNHL
jgi:hypothetical protein